MSIFVESAAAIIVIATIAGVAVGKVPVFRMNRATIALTGAALLMAIGAISLEQGYEALDLDTLTLLFAMMIINANLRRAGFFQLVAQWVIKRSANTAQLLALIIVASGILSALFLNDTIVLVFTPLVLDLCLALERRPVPYLIGLVVAANIGSVATIIGNPQNMIIGIASGIPFNTFLLYQLPIALVGLVIGWGVILLVYRGEFVGVPLKKEGAGTSELHYRIEQPLLNKSLAATGLMVVAFVLGMPIPLAALVAASMLLISRRREPELVFHEIDWSLLVFFSGLFIVTGALQTTGLSGMIFGWVQPFAEQGVAQLALVSAVLSNLVSNVPAVLLFRPIIPTFPNPTQAWLTLSMATTLAGNLTLLGSVANLIVAEIARQRNVTLGFMEYLKCGVWITLGSLAFGILWLTFVFR